MNIIGRDGGGGGPRESYVSGTCRRRRRARCARERKGAVYVGATSTSRLFSSYMHAHRHDDGVDAPHTHTHRCSPVQVSRMYCIATAEAVVKGGRARRQRHIYNIICTCSIYIYINYPCSHTRETHKLSKIYNDNNNIIIVVPSYIYVFLIHLCASLMEQGSCWRRPDP